MKKRLISSAIILSCFILLSLGLNTYSQDGPGDERSYSEDVERLFDHIALCDRLLKEGKKLYSERDYVNAKVKFEELLFEEPDNKEAKKYSGLCDKKIKEESRKEPLDSARGKKVESRKGKVEEEKKVKVKVLDLDKEEKKKKELRKREKAALESKAWGLLGVRKEGMEEVLADIPAKDIPKRELTLEECIQIAKENNLPLMTAEKQVKLANIRLWEARRKLAPALKAKWEESSGEIYGQGYEGRKMLVEGSQPIFHGGELIFTVSQARLNLEIVTNDYDRIKNDIILKVEKAYYSLDKAIKYLGIQRKIYERSKGLNDFIEKAYQEGIVSKIEYLNVTSKYEQVDFQFVSAEEDISLAKLILQQAMNTEEDVDIVTVEEPKIADNVTLENCYALALANRPEMKINYLMSEYYLYEKKIASASGWPKVDLMGSYGYSYEDFVKEEDLDGRTRHSFEPEWYGGVKLSWPFFGNTLGYSLTREHWQPVVGSYRGTDTMTHVTTLGILDNLKYYSDVTEADIGFDRAKEEYNKVKQEITLELKETFFKYKKAVLQMKVAKIKLEFQRRQVEFTEAKMEMNEALASDVLEQLIRLGEEEFSLLQAYADYYIAIKSLNKAIGMAGYFDVTKGE